MLDIPTGIPPLVASTRATRSCHISSGRTTHRRYSTHRPKRREGEFIPIASAAAARLSNRRVLLAGTDMAVGKMTAAIELDRLAKARSIDSAFLATGQVGIAISGAGVALKASVPATASIVSG